MTKREPGFYWARIPQHGPGRSPHPDSIAFTHGDGRWFFTGRDEPMGEFEVVPLAGPLKLEPEPSDGADAFVLMNALAAATRANIEMRTTLTATQTRCTELLDESRAKGRTIVQLEAKARHDEGMLDHLLARVEAERAAAFERQAVTIQRLRAAGYRVVKRCGACVSLAFERE
jgi:hypothetical protein